MPKHIIVIAVRILFILVLLIISLSFTHHANAVRYAQCDPCGLCKDTARSKSGTNAIYVQPKSWESCFTCLYPQLTLTPPVPTSVPCNKDEFDKNISFINVGNSDTTVTSALKRCDTIIIDSTKNEPQNKPVSGRMFTDIGCISVDSANKRFNDPNASVDVVQKLLNIILGLTGGIGMISIMIAAIKLLTSRGDPEKITEGKKSLTNTIVGVLFALFALLIFRFISGPILHIPGLN